MLKLHTTLIAVAFFCGGPHSASAASSFLQRKRVATSPQTSWAVGFPRTGTTSLLKFLKWASEGRAVGANFTLFEPCHYGDHAPTLHSCSEVMSEVLNCNFDKIDTLSMWSRSWDGDVWGDGIAYSPTHVSEVCRGATARSVKTVNVHDLEHEVIPLLEAHPELRVINIVRDPRGTYQSAKTMGWPGVMSMISLDPHFIGLDGPTEAHIPLTDSLFPHGEKVEYLRYICNALVNMSHVSHPRMLTVRFEDMISEQDSVRTVADFLGLPWDTRTQQSANNAFSPLPLDKPWAQINHYPNPNHDSWTEQELAELNSPMCHTALDKWGYL